MSCGKKETYRFNRIKWKIHESEIEDRRNGMELLKIMRDVYLGYIDGRELERFGTSPVRNAYWAFGTPGVYTVRQEVRDLFDSALTTSPSARLVFRRLENLMPDRKDILLEAFLGFQDIVGCKYADKAAILNDDWVLNLTTTKENFMMEALLRRAKEMENACGSGIDVGEELKDLLKIYTDAEEHLKQKEASALEVLTSYMKRYVEAKEERMKVSMKLYNLKLKLTSGKKEECEEEEEKCT